MLLSAASSCWDFCASEASEVLRRRTCLRDRSQQIDREQQEYRAAQSDRRRALAPDGESCSLCDRNVDDQRIFRHLADRHVANIVVGLAENAKASVAFRQSVEPDGFVRKLLARRVSAVRMAE